MPDNKKQRLFLILCVGLALITLFVYWPVRNNDFVNYDDDVYVTKNLNVQSGLSPQTIKWALTTLEHSYWHPMTWLSHMLDRSIFGVKPGPMHLVNLFFHVVNTILLFLVISRMTKTLWPGAFVAALFALHPLNVESVAWIAERKNVLSTFFWLLTMLAYARYAERPSASRYLITFLFFALGLMSKPMVITLPFVLLLLDFWPLNRFSISSPDSPGFPFFNWQSAIGNRQSSTLNSQFSILNSILEKLPFFLLSAFSAVITCVAVKKVGSLVSIPLKERLANMAVSYLAYIYKLFVPARLAVLYPHPADRIPVIKAVLCAVLLILLTVIFLYFGRRRKYLAFGWLWFLGTLVPVIGIVQAGAQAMADRYAYVTFIGLFVIIAFGFAELVSRIPSSKTILAVLASVSLIACAVVTSVQLKHWKDNSTLFEHTLAVTQNNFLILNNYANTLSDRGRGDEAVKYLTQAIKFMPDSPDVYNNLGVALKKLGRIDEAIEQYKKALEINPAFTVAHCNLGVALMAKGDYDAAIEHYKIYLGVDDANDPNLQQDMAIALASQGKIDDAVGQFQKALVARPDSAEVLSNLGFALAQSGKPHQAIDCYNKALRLEPGSIITHGRLALALAAVGRFDESIEQCRIVLAACPNDAEMHTNLGILLAAKGLTGQAAESFKKALQIDPNSKKAHENLDALTQKSLSK